MKNTLKLLAIGIAVSAATMAEAQTVIRITGSTAFRKGTIIAIQNKMGGASAARGAYVGSSLTGANIAILRGNISGVGDTIVKCSWSGAVGGIQTVVQNLNVATWLDNSQIPANPNTYNSIASASAIYDPASPADVAMGDSDQAATGFNSPALVAAGGGPVGVIPFQWVANSGSPAGLNNISQLQAQQLSTSLMQLSQFTGNSADSGTQVYLTGRNFDSGTRLNTLAEAGIGVFGNVQQVQPAFNTGSGGCASTIIGLNLWPAETVLGIFFDVGQSGYASGGNLADAMASPGSGTAAGGLGAGWLVGYMGINDAARAVGADGTNPCSTAHVMKWNGEDYSETNVREGKYTFWGYEYLLYRGSLSGLQKTVADGIAAQIKNADAVQSGILLSTMNVSRPTAGGVISHN